MMEVAVYYPFLYASTVEPEVLQWCVTAALLKHLFLDLAGRWETVPDPRSIPVLPQIMDMADFVERLRMQDSASEPAQMQEKLSPPSMRDLSGE